MQSKAMEGRGRWTGKAWGAFARQDTVGAREGKSERLAGQIKEIIKRVGKFGWLMGE